MKIHHTAITVLSLEKSIEFYKEVFGLEVVSTFLKENWSAKAVMMSDGFGNMLELWQFEDSSSLPESQNNFSAQGIKHIAFETDDAEMMWNKLKEKYECTNITIAKISTYFFIKDPTGITLEIYQTNK